MQFEAIEAADGEVTFKSLSPEVAGISTTVSDTDVPAVLNEGSSSWYGI